MKAGKTIIPAGRKRELMQYVQEHGSAQIHELSEVLGVSEATVRRDLTALHEEGLVLRTHGGAVPVEVKSTSFEPKYQAKAETMMEEKRRIGAYAAAMVEDGDTVFLDSGTTTYCVAMNLAEKKHITVITYDLYIASDIELDATSSLVVTGGTRRPGHGTLVGSVARNFIESIRVDKTFLSTDAVDIEFGISNANFFEADIKSLIARAAHQTILVADHTKFGNVALTRVCTLDEVSAIVTDSGLGTIFRELLAEGSNLHLV